MSLYALWEQTRVKPQVTQAKEAAHILEDWKATSWDDSIFVV